MFLLTSNSPTVPPLFRWYSYWSMRAISVMEIVEYVWVSMSFKSDKMIHSFYCWERLMRLINKRDTSLILSIFRAKGTKGIENTRKKG